MKFEKRLRAVEGKFLRDPVILDFASGSCQEICRGGYLLDLFTAALGGADLSAEQSSELDLIRQSVAAREPGGGRIIEALQALTVPAEEVKCS